MEGDAPQVSVTPTPPEAKPVIQDVPQPSASQQPTPVAPQSPADPTPPPEPKKRLNIKILIIVGVALMSLGLGGFFVWKYLFPLEAPVTETKKVEEKQEKREEEVFIYKGIWIPTLLLHDSNYLASNISQFKELGINTIFMAAFPPLTEADFKQIEEFFSPELLERLKEIIPNEKELLIANIQTAHNNGLRVALTIGDPPGVKSFDVEALNLRIVEVAKIAEENDVELFAPLNEPGKFFGENTGKWRQEILTKVKKVYHGDIVAKGPGLELPDKETIARIPNEPSGDFSGYDYVGSSTLFMSSEGLEPEEKIRFADRITLESYAQYVEGVLDYMSARAERDGCKGVMLTEFGVLGEESLSETEIARAYEIVLEKGKDRALGFIAFDFLEVELPGIPLIEENPEAKAVVKRYFTEIIPEKKLIVY